MNGKALEQRTALAVSAWLVPLFKLGCAVAEIFVGYTQPCLSEVSLWLEDILLVV